MPKRFLASVLPQHEIAELYRLMVIGIKEVAVFLMDPHGIITVWNKGAEEMKGFTAATSCSNSARPKSARSTRSVARHMLWHKPSIRIKHLQEFATGNVSRARHIP